ncbi:histone-lysine N-methyltransferase ATXR6-like isoform X3 [Triticum dicoccoides]|nr:histone-lysine N-methyltransferase ATXR6-like isoform X2 [Triticum dicoccoides]XP_037487657.1 histone-lysine N-methyltransferase ATXR6-like isoform X2 [Triticum dicoccoides]XP_037487658.1 histone-lysine N-methyltransferase ATXR6-like isoform X3 [Triticum dicoccoides]
MPKQFPLIQTKIVDFFKIQRRPAAAAAEPPEGKKRKRKATSALVVSEKKSRKLPFTPSKDPVRRLTQMASLATALTATSVVFSNDLTYVPDMASWSANQSALVAGGMQVLPREDAETLSLCKRMVEQGASPRRLQSSGRICNDVAIAKIMEATLILPVLKQDQIWKDQA